jgi:class 3 adenylate cyclase
MAGRSPRPEPRTFLFADLRGYTAYVERAGDAAATRLLRTYRTLVRRAVSAEGGVEIKTEGDSFYVVCESSVAAVRCAVAIQRAAARQRSAPLAIGIGIHTGETTPFDGQYVGSAVNIAARLAAAAGGGEILVSETVRALIRTALPLPFADRGGLALKGIAESVHAYSLRVTEPPASASPDAGAAPRAGPCDTVRLGDLEGAIRRARAVRPGASLDERCDALAALALVAAAHGDVEAALRRGEDLLALGLRVRDRSWVRAAYGLRAWLYFLARQGGEAVAELDRALARPGAGLNACLPLLLAVSLGGTARQAVEIRHLGMNAGEPGLGAACLAVADAVEEGREPAPPLDAVAGPFCGAVVELQLSARFNRAFAPERHDALIRAGAEPLLALVRKAVAQ